MSLTTQLNGELIRLIGFSSNAPRTVALSAPDQVVVAIDFVAVDSMSCAAQEIRLSVPALVGAPFETLKKWGDELCKRISYLLENIGPVEVDPDAGEVLIRSTPPDTRPGRTRYYEVMLHSQSAGNFTLRRFQAEKGKPGRKPVDLQTTHEVLDRLVNDLVETIPD